RCRHGANIRVWIAMDQLERGRERLVATPEEEHVERLGAQLSITMGKPRRGDRYQIRAAVDREAQQRRRALYRVGRFVMNQGLIARALLSSAHLLTSRDAPIRCRVSESASTSRESLRYTLDPRSSR